MRKQPKRNSSKAAKKSRAVQKQIIKKPQFSEKRRKLFSEIEDIIGMKFNDEQKIQIDLKLRIDQHGTVHEQVKK